ncbi:MAG TPA: T9SS type A sorting domain-containing protein [Firmicutes bacterium]|nr:T9SS type A sorting domain-containing protein [Bacillota bacterium]
MVIDSDDRPHISFQNNECLEYAYFDGIDWNIEVVDSNGDVGRFAAICLDSRGNPHISYYDDNPNYHLKYAWYGPDNDITLLSFTADASKPSAVNLRWSISADEGDDILGFNLYRRELKEGAIHKLRIRPGDVWEASVRENYNSPLQRDNILDWQKVNSVIITGTNPYSYTDTGVAENTQYEYKLEAVMGGDSGETLGTTTVETGIPASFGIVRLYPNPCRDELNISLSSPDRTKVKIYMYDISGRCILSEEISDITESEADIRLNVSGLSSGIYTIKVVNVDGEVSSKRALVLR